ncbi:hypothetical protein DYB36_005109 [Aphanomyces astaci]|uniref:Prolyl 4-hydroxylase alpha subunit domain-containing protein n=2 Tax=Aphanomyces astaci TaxID=112090 RepID=A0A397BKX7_APHAT|nr:hypothetical protein DYB36_005109 [Aphanomyces astaci]
MVEPTLAEKPTLPTNVHRYGCVKDDIMFEVLDSVLTEAECRALINRMSPALKSVSGALSRLHPLGEQRASKTEYCLSVMENKRFADVIWQRLMDSEAFASIYKYTQREGCGMPLGLAPRLRLLRYEGSDRFDAHYDRIVPDEATGSESLITVLIYLNDGGGVDFSGGETLYINPENMAESVGVVPRRGRVVLFEHCLYHSGSPLQHIDDSANQRKYVMRTDILVPLVLVCGWMHAPSRGVAKYANLFQRLGYRTEVVESHVGHLFMPPAWIHAKSPTVAALESAASIANNDDTELVIIPHLISGGGCISWYCVERHLRQRGVRFFVPAMIFDSSPNSGKGFDVFEGSFDKILDDFTSTTTSPVKRWIARTVLKAGWAAVMLRWSGRFGPDPLQRNFAKLIIADAAIPKLFLYSSNDVIITAPEVEEAIAAAAAGGTPLDQVNFHTSLHVSHYLDYPEVYEQSIVNFLTKYVP